MVFSLVVLLYIQMSHLQSIDEAQQTCEATEQCSQYQTLLQEQDQQIDTYLANDITTAITWGVIAGVIGLTVLLTPFVEPLRRFQRFLLPKLAIAAPVLVGLVAGAAAGFAISFSACFKQSCSAAESSAMLTLPLLSLVATVPLARVIYKRRQGMASSIGSPQPAIWLVIGSIIIALAASLTLSSIAEHKNSAESQKKYLRRSVD